LTISPDPSPTDAAWTPPVGVILTGGMGTRLKPLTPATPKSLVPLLNRPLIAHGLELMRGFDVRETVVVVGGGDTRTGPTALAWAPEGMRVTVAVQEEPRGSADAVASAGAALDGKSAIVLAVDTVLRGVGRDQVEAFTAAQADAGLLLAPVEDPRPFGVALLNGDLVVDLEEKPSAPKSNLALVGVWMLGPRVIERLRNDPVIKPNGEADVTSTIAASMREQDARVLGWPIAGEWLDAGTLEGLLHTQSRLLRDVPESGRGECELVGTTLGGQWLLGAGVRLEDCELEGVVLGDGVRLRNSRLRNSLVMPGAQLEGLDYADVIVLSDGRICGPGAQRVEAEAAI